MPKQGQKGIRIYPFTYSLGPEREISLKRNVDPQFYSTKGSAKGPTTNKHNGPRKRERICTYSRCTKSGGFSVRNKSIRFYTLM